MTEPTNQNQTIDIQEALLERYDALPQDLKDTMMSVETAETIFEIGKKFGLNIEKTGKLAEEIGFVILGVVPSKDFVGDLTEILEVDADKASAVASEVNHRIFLKIRETLKTLHGVRWVDQMTEKPFDVARQKPFAGVERRIAPAEIIEKNKEAIPSILAEIQPANGKQTDAPATPPATEPSPAIPTEIKPTGEQPAATKTPPPTPETIQTVPTEIKPEITEQKKQPAPALDVAHEIAAPAAPATSNQPPAGLPVEEQPIQNMPPAQKSAQPTPNKYLVDPYREPFE